MSNPRLSKSGIEYLDYFWGIWSGCRNLEVGICPVKACWAKGLTSHFPKIYPNGFEPTYYIEALDSPKHLKKPSRISVGWVGDVIGYCDSHSIAKESIFEVIKQCPQHKFLFLTKNSEKLFTWGKFPDNCWVGVSATDRNMAHNAFKYLHDIKASVKYISFEPLLSWGDDPISLEQSIYGGLTFAGISWVILGSQTKPTVMPKIEWVREIVEAADKAGISVFLKNNLRDLLIPDALMDDIFWASDKAKLRQEMPR